MHLATVTGIGIDSTAANGRAQVYVKRRGPEAGGGGTIQCDSGNAGANRSDDVDHTDRKVDLARF